MKGYLIDPYEKQITLVEHNGDLQDMYQALRCSIVEAVQITSTGDVVYVDEEGLLKDLSQQSFFKLTGPGASIVLAGRGLVLGTTDEGDSTDPVISLRELTPMVSWKTLAELRAAQH